MLREYREIGEESLASIGREIREIISRRMCVCIYIYILSCSIRVALIIISELRISVLIARRLAKESGFKTDRRIEFPQAKMNDVKEANIILN